MGMVGFKGRDGKRERCFDINKINALWVCFGIFSGCRGAGVGMSL
jgi:hypothetical protein